MIATLEHELSVADNTPCPTCGTSLVFKGDAIGRTRSRCPRCDRVAPERPSIPGEVLMPQGLVPATALPAVREGQLRCQRCARGVEGKARFCSEQCATPVRETGTVKARGSYTYKPKPCLEPSCRKLFTPTGPNSRYCPECA